MGGCLLMMLEKKGGGANPPQNKGHKDEETRSKLQEPENPGREITGGHIIVITMS